MLENGQKSTEVRLAQKTDLKPKGAKSAYIFFVSEKVGPLMTEKKIACTEAMKLVSAMWNELSDKDKKPYNDLNAQDKERQAAQLAEIAKKGFFMIDGKKSCDVEPKKKKVKRVSSVDATPIAIKKGPNSPIQLVKSQKIK